MKTQNRILYILAIFLILSSAISAQKRRLIGDFRIGANFSEMDIAGANKNKNMRLGFSMGGSVSLRLFSNLYVQSGLSLSKKGLRQHDKSISVQDESLGQYVERDLRQTIDVNYMQIPIALGLEIPLGKSTSINVYGGAYGGYAFRGYVNPYHGTETYWIAGNKNVVWLNKEEQDIFDTRRIKRFDYGAIGSVGFVWSIYSLTLGYEHGLYDIADVSALTDDGSEKKVLKNRNISLALGFRF